MQSQDYQFGSARFAYPLSRGHFDSASDLREEVDPVALLAGEETKLFVFRADGRGAVVPAGAEGFRLWQVDASLLPRLAELADRDQLWFMGRKQDAGGDVNYLALRVGDRGPLTDLVAQAMETADARWVEVTAHGADLMDDQEALLFTQVSALSAWHSQQKFCRLCGQGTTVGAAGWNQVCVGCGAVEYPRIDPAIIVEVRNQRDELLLLHNVAWEAKRMSLLAGYVDAGETPERTVVREVWEEAALNVKKVRYLGAQPWPRPRSLMLTYSALVDCPPDMFAANNALDCGEPVPDLVEVDRAQFFSRKTLRNAVEEGEVKLPGPSAVAYTIIDSWLREDGGPGLGRWPAW